MCKKSGSPPFVCIGFDFRLDSSFSQSKHYLLFQRYHHSIIFWKFLTSNIVGKTVFIYDFRFLVIFQFPGGRGTILDALFTVMRLVRCGGNAKPLMFFLICGKHMINPKGAVLAVPLRALRLCIPCV